LPDDDDAAGLELDDAAAPEKGDNAAADRGFTEVFFGDLPGSPDTLAAVAVLPVLTSGSSSSDSSGRIILS
jgi:hypothetical protein